MRLPRDILREIIDLPEGRPTSFTVRTDGRKEWKLELHKTLHTDERELVDLGVLWRVGAKELEKR